MRERLMVMNVTVVIQVMICLDYQQIAMFHAVVTQSVYVVEMIPYLCIR